MGKRNNHDEYPISGEWDSDPVKENKDPLAQYVAKAEKLFVEIEKRLGRKAARRIFDWCVETRGDRFLWLAAYLSEKKGVRWPPGFKPLGPKKAEVVELYYKMKPWPNKDQLAQQLAEGNKTVRGRYGSGSTNMPTMRKYIHRAVEEAGPDSILALMLRSRGQK